MEGRKDYICSSRLGLIRWYDRFRSDRRIQQVKAILDKVRYTNDILLPHELLHGASAIHKQSSILVPHTLQSRALKDHVAFVPNCTLVTQQTQALGPRGASAASLNHWEAVGTHPEAQQDTHATSSERLHERTTPCHAAPAAVSTCGCCQSGMLKSAS